MFRYIALSTGEISGTSVEMIIRAILSDPYKGGEDGIVVVGDEGIYRYVSSALSYPFPFDAVAHSEEELREAEHGRRRYILYAPYSIDLTDFEFGRISSETGRSTYEALRYASLIIMNGYADLLITTPISIMALRAFGSDALGVQDLLSLFSSSARSMNMLKEGKANIFLLSKKSSLKEQLEAITEENIMNSLIHMDSYLQTPFFDSSKPIAIGSVNPQARDGRWFGTEEEEIIIPAIAKARMIGLSVEGPIAADRLYKRAFNGEYTAVLSLLRGESYAALGGETALIITLGLPFVRIGLTAGVGLKEGGKGECSLTNIETALAAARTIDAGGFTV